MLLRSSPYLLNFMAIDYVVKLYELPPPVMNEAADIRRALPTEKHLVLDFVQRNFGQIWASETDAAFSNKPVTCFIAVKDSNIVGFCAYEATCKAFVGPRGVHPDFRLKGIGTSLRHCGLHGLKELGYAYGILAAAKESTTAFNAIPIPGSSPGFYKGMLRQ